jgi:oxalate decarboxylase
MITERAQPDNEGRNPFFRPLSRRDILGVGSGLAATLLAATVSDAQQRTKTQEDERDHSASNQNRTLLAENPGSNMPPATHQGDVGPIWYSFDLAHKRIQEGGWTHQVTQRELPSSKDLAGVNMRLTAGSFRELHWRLPTSGQSCSAATPASAF